MLHHGQTIDGSHPALHGSRDRATWDYVGYNSWLDEAQAAFLRVMLPKQVAPTGAHGAAGHYEAACWAIGWTTVAHRGRSPRMAPLRDPLAHAYAIADALSRAEIGNEVCYRRSPTSPSLSTRG